MSMSDIALSTIALICVIAAGFQAYNWLSWRRRRRPTCAELIEQFFRPLRTPELSCIARVFPTRIKADLQLTLDKVLRNGFEICTFTGVRQEYNPIGIEFNSIVNAQAHGAAQIAAIQCEEVDVGADQPVRCMQNGLWLLKHGQAKLLLLMAPAEKYGQTSGIRIEIVTAPGAQREQVAQTIFRAIEDGIRDAGSYRGKVLSLEQLESYSGQSHAITVHRIRPVSRDQLILPERTLQLIDRNILQFAAQRPSLIAQGLSAKKGLLLYGAPGTGKTHTLHYLLQALEGHTFLLMNAEQQALLTEYITLARLLQPSVVVMEDADLIARNRNDVNSPCIESLLNRLLNEMDGLRPDAQIFFVLTTNRPQTLEPALSARPGRIDQAIEFPLPDAHCRERLVQLYAGALQIAPSLVAQIVAQTEGVSPAFIKELMRRAAQYAFAAKRNSSLLSNDVEEALQEMLHQGGALNMLLLGAQQGGEVLHHDLNTR